MERTRSETLKLFVVSDVGRRSSPLSSIRSERSWQFFLPRSVGPFLASCLWPIKPRRTPGTDRLSAGGDDRRPLEQILQIVIAILVESANRVFLGSLQLSIDGTMIGTATCFYGQTTVFPQRPLGSEAVRSLQNAQQHSCPDRANRGDLAELFPGLLLFTLRQQLAPHSQAQHSQRIQLLVIKLRPPGALRVP